MSFSFPISVVLFRVLIKMVFTSKTHIISKEYIEKESVFSTYRDTSGIQSETSEYETDTSISKNDSDSDEESPSYAPPPPHIASFGSFTATSANLAVTDLIILGFL